MPIRKKIPQKIKNLRKKHLNFKLSEDSLDIKISNKWLND